MKKINLANKYSVVLSLAFASIFPLNNAFANAQIQGLALSKGIAAPSCQSCHTGTAGSESVSNLKPNYLAAYALDPTGLTRLKNVINGCPSGQVINTTTFLCQAATPVPAAVTKSDSVGSTLDSLPATDVWAVTCATGTTSLAVSVLDKAPAYAPVVSIQAVYVKAPAFLSSPLSTDAVDGDALYSPVVKVAGGVGPYSVQINKQAHPTVKVAELYTAKFACLNAAGANTAVSSVVLKQNQ